MFNVANALARTAQGCWGPSPPFRGEREGPDPQGWEGEVGGATNRLVGPLTLPFPPASGGRG